MTEYIFIGLGTITFSGIVAQWLAWRFKLPSILFLLIFGFIVGPVTGFLNPDRIFGELLMPIISFSVAIILFEGGLTLRMTELKGIGKVVRNLISIGILITWTSVAGLSYYLLHLSFELSILIGAILVVTGPTVIGPLLRHIRPARRIGNIVKWEGILNDPIGALFAVLIFEAISAGVLQQVGLLIFAGIFKTLVLGFGLGFLGALSLALPLRRFWIPDFLHEAVTTMMVVIVFLISNHFQEESGLFAVTIMGVVLANQKSVNIKHIVQFKENLRILIISSLFIILAARLRLSDFYVCDVNSFLFLGALIFVVRPLAVFLSAAQSDLNWREKLFITWMAPRGIVAAAIAAIFAIRLAELGFEQTENMVPLVFMVIIGTVGLYGLSAPLLARWLTLAEADPQGLVFVGAHEWARALARILHEAEFKILMIDANLYNVFQARMDGLVSYHGSVISDYIFEELEFDGFGRLLALTSNDEANSLAVLHFYELFGRSEVYQLAPVVVNAEDEAVFIAQHLRGRYLFGKGVNFNTLTEKMKAGAEIRSLKLTEEYDFSDFQTSHGLRAMPLIVISETGKLVIFTQDHMPQPRVGQTLVYLLEKTEQKKKENGPEHYA